ISADTLFQQDIAVANAATDYEVDFAAAVARIKAFFMVSDAAVTMETNSGSEAADTIVLVANQPYFWYTGSLHTSLLTTDITALFFTNASGSNATVQIRCLYDATAS